MNARPGGKCPLTATGITVMDGGAAGSTVEDWETLAPLPPAATGHEHGRGWEAVATVPSTSAYDDSIIFPPCLHEGLHLRPGFNPDPAETAPPALPCRQEQIGAHVGPPLSGEAKETAEAEELELPFADRFRPFTDSARQFIDSGLEVIRSNIFLSTAGAGGSGRLIGGKVWSLAAVAGFMGVLMFLRRRHRREKELLLLLIQEKDQRISQLLNQISLMKELLAERRQVTLPRHL